MANAEEKEKLRLLQQIEEIYTKMGKVNPYAGMLKVTDTLSDIIFALNESKAELSEVDGGVQELLGGWQAILDETKAYNNSISASKRSLNDLSSIASKLRDHQLGTNTLHTKDLEKIQQKYNAESSHLEKLKTALEAQIKSGTLSGKQLDQARKLYSNINALIKENDSLLRSTNRELEATVNFQKDIDKQLGFYPQILGGVDKILKRMGMPNLGVDDAILKTRALGEEARLLGKDFEAFPVFMSQLKNNIKEAITPANLLQAAFTMLLKVLKEVDTKTGEFAKKMNMSYSESLKVRGELVNIASQSETAAINSGRLLTTYMAVGAALKSTARLNEQDLVTMTKLVEMAGLQHDQLMEIQKISLINNKTLEDNTKEILGAVVAYNAKNKLALNEKEILKEVNNMSASLKLSLGQSADNMARAAAQAQKFGISLRQSEQIAQSLLNFESSIENELAAELITGQAINLERARGLALSGDTAQASAEILKQVGSAAEFGRMNVIQQEAIAKAVGMQKDELAQSLIDREALSKLGVNDAKNAQDAYNKLKARKLSEEEIAKRLGNDELARMYEQQSIQERFNNTVLKLQEIFVAMSEPILAIVEPIASMAEILSSIPGILETIMIGYGAIKAMQLASYALELATTHQKLVQQGLTTRQIIMERGLLSTLVAKAVAWTIMNPIPALIGAGIAAGIGGLIYSQMKDGVIDPKKGPVMSGEFGTVQLDPNDKAMYGADGKIKVGTNLNPQQGGGGTNMAPLITEIKALRAEINKRPIQTSVQIDGKQVASATANNSQTFYNSSNPNNFKIQ